MKQVEICEPYKISIKDVEDPIKKKADVLIKVSAAGICGSDVHIFKGENPALKPPHVSGHEFGGVVLETGNANTIKPGDKVVVNPVINCGECYYCRNQQEHLCDAQHVIGGHITGAMQEKISVPSKNIFSLPSDFDMNLSTLIEPSAVAVHSSGKYRDSTVLVLGLGTVGLLSLQVLKQNNNTVIATDINEYNLNLAEKLGADFVLNFNDTDRDAKLDTYLGGKKLDCMIENVNSKKTLFFATETVKKGGEIVLVGIPPANFEVNVLSILFRELSVLSSTLYSDKEFGEARDLVVQKKINVKDLLSRTFPLTQAQTAFDYKISNKEAIKVNVVAL